jgi:hypothetical protein
MLMRDRECVGGGGLGTRVRNLLALGFSMCIHFELYKLQSEYNSNKNE